MFEDEDFIDFPELLNRYEEMIQNETIYFFDVEEFEALSSFLFDTGQTQKALQLIQIGANQHPESVELKVKKTRFLTAINKLREADYELAALEELIPGSFDLLMARAYFYSRKSQHTKAIKLYKEALPLAEFPDEVWPVLAMEYQFTGNYQLAIKYLRLTLEVNPEDEIAIYNMALCFNLLNKTEAGIDFFKQFVDNNPYNEMGWYQLGMLYGEISDLTEAIKAFDYAILIDEFFTAAYFEKARIQELDFDFIGAIRTYQEDMEQEGESGYNLYRIGLCHLKLHQPQKAESFLRQAIHEDPDLDEAFYELALIQDENKRWDEAVYHINKAIELDPENWDYLYTSAEVHRRAGKLNEAEIIYQDLIKLGYIDPDVFIDYAELLFDLCEFKEGMDLLYQGVALNPEAPEIHYRIAGYLFTLQESDEATIYFKKALDLNPGGKTSFFSLFPKLKEHRALQNILKEPRC